MRTLFKVGFYDTAELQASMEQRRRWYYFYVAADSPAAALELALRKKPGFAVAEEFTVTGADHDFIEEGTP
jgi:hypothetical protein